MGMYLTILKRALRSFGAHRDTSFAGAIAYSAIFSIVPLLLLGVAVLGFVIHSPAQRAQIVDGLFNGLGGSISRGALQSEINTIAGGSAGIGVIGALAAAWGATGVFDQIRTALLIVWNSDRPRPFVQQKLIDLGMIATVGALVLLAIVVMGVLTALSTHGSSILAGTLSVALKDLILAASIVIPTALLFCAFALLYWIVPHAKVRLRNTWVGALLAAVLFELVQLLFAYYVAYFGHFNKTYGTLGGAVAFLFFLWVIANITLLGGEVAKEYTDVVTGMKPLHGAEPQGPETNLGGKILGALEGLFVDKTPHHDTSRPYEPGRNEPLEPSGSLVTDGESRPITDVHQPEDGNRSLQGRTAPDA
jgi:membrane protein